MMSIRLGEAKPGGSGLSSITKTDRSADLDAILLEARKELETLRYEIDRYKLVFDSARLLVGHEFIKPLTAISGYVELMESNLRDGEGAKRKRYIKKVKDAVARLEELVDSTVQMFSTENRVERVYAWERVDVGVLLERVRSRFGEFSGRMRSEVQAGLSGVVLRRRGLEVVIENLVSNALKHSEGSAKVVVEASLIKDRRGGSAGELLLVRVKDHGEGIPEDELNRVFDPFYRSERSKKRQGLGLGLALVKSVITIMNGEIHIKSRIGEGTTVTFSVPVGESVCGPPETVG
jgi:signal transduction histidine kinase